MRLTTLLLLVCALFVAVQGSVIKARWLSDCNMKCQQVDKLKPHKRIDCMKCCKHLVGVSDKAYSYCWAYNH